MTRGSKVRLFFGILIVIVAVGALTLFLIDSMSRSTSVKATLEAQARSIGTDYSGLVVAQEVEEGDTVKKDDVLFEIDSQQLKQSLDNGTVKRESLTVTLNSANNNIQVRANNDGVIDTINFREGAYVPSNAVIATQYVIDSQFVKAHFKLSPPDYARIDEGIALEVLFPDNTKKKATITTVSLESSEDEQSVETVVIAKINDTDMSDFRFAVGTPVDATLQLQQDTWYQSIYNFVQRLFTPQE